MPPSQEELENSPKEPTAGEDTLPYVFIDNTFVKDQTVVSQQPTPLSNLAEQQARAADVADADAGDDDWLGFSGEESMLSHSLHSSFWHPENGSTDTSFDMPTVSAEIDAFSMLDQYHMEQTQFIETYLGGEQDRRSETISSPTQPPLPPPTSEPPTMSRESMAKDPAPIAVPTVVTSKPLLSQHSIEDGELLLSQKAVAETEPTPTPSLNGTTVSLNNDASLSDGEIRDSNLATDNADSNQLDVEAIVKGRLDEMLKLKDPKLLQSAPFRALMLLLRCIKFDDPDKMYAAVKASPFPVASQLSELATEFGLVFISDACINALLSTTDAGNEVVVSEKATPAPSLVSQKNQVESDSESMDMETQPSSTSSSPSLHGNDTSIINGVVAAEDMDMDTTSASPVMEDRLTAIALPPPALPTSSMAATHTTIFSLAGDPITPTTPRSQIHQSPSREVTPSHQMHSRFSRSRAPSPPSAQPCTPSRHFTSASHNRQQQQSLLSDTRGIGNRTFEHALNLAPLQSMRQFEPGFSTSIGAVNVNGRFMAQQSIESSSPELMGNRSDERATSKSEYDRLVVYLAADECDLSDTSDVGDMASDPEMDTDLGRFHKQENSIMNRMCRKLAALPNSHQGMDSGSGTPMSVTSANLSRLSLSGEDSSDKSCSSTALIQAKENLKAQESAIAKLKAQIDRKQRVASLRKKLRESKANIQQPQAETPSDTAMDSVSTPTTPTKMDVESALPEPSMLAPVPPEAVATTATAIKIEKGEAGNSHDMVDNTTTTITSGYPQYDECRQKYMSLSIDVRAKHVEEVASTLADVKAKKGKELKLAEYKHRKQQEVPECIAFLLDTRRQSESLDKRQSQLEIREVEIKQLLRKLQAELDVVSLEKRIIDCGTSISPSLPVAADSADTDVVAALIREVAEVTELVNMFKWLPTNATDNTPADSIIAQPSPKPPLLIDLTKEKSNRNVPSSSAPPATQQDKGKAAEQLPASSVSPATQKDKGKGVEKPSLSVPPPGTQPDKSKAVEQLPSLSVDFAVHDTEGPAQMATNPPPVSSNQATNSSSKAALLRSKLDALEKSTTQVFQSLESRMANQKRTAEDAGIITVADSPNKRPKGPEGPQQLGARALLIDLIKSLRLTAGEKKKASGSNLWPNTWCLPADDCIIQPLPIVDNAHMSKMVDLTTFFFPMVQSRFKESKEKSLSQPASSIAVPTPANGNSHHPVSDVSKGLHTAYVSSPSPTGPSTSTSARPATEPVDQYADFLTKHMDVWVKATEADLRKAVAPQSVNKQGYLTQLQARLKDALRELLDKDNREGDSSLSHAKIAMTIFRVYSNYVLCGGKVSCNDILFLTEAFSFHLEVDLPCSVGAPIAPISNIRPLGLEDEKQLNIFIQCSDDVLPILNQDLLKLTYFAQAKGVAQNPQKGARYFEKDGKGGQQSTASGTAPDAEEEEMYKQASKLLWKGFPAKSVEKIGEADILAYVGTKHNPHIAKAIGYLDKATNRFPQSERLWDLLLELLVHGDHSVKMISKRFTSAAKAVPQNIRIWQRYVYWCWHNSRLALKEINGGFDKWPQKLSEVVVEAMKSLCGEGNKEQGQQLSVEAMSSAVTSMLVYYWDSQWVWLEGYCVGLQATQMKDMSKKIAKRRAKLIADMGICIRSQTLEEMVTIISGCSTISNSDRSAEVETSTTEWWKEGQRVLADLLLPHHLLLLTQVYFASYVSGSSVPATVFSQMLAASCIRPNQHMAYYIDIDMLKSKNSTVVASDGSIKADIISTLSGLFDIVGGGLKKHGVINTSGSQQQTDSIVKLSTRVCCESLFATLSCASEIASSIMPRSQLRTYDICLSGARSMSIPAILDSTFLDDMVNNDPDKCLPITAALCRGEYQGSLKEVGWRVVLLREHAAKLAKRLGVVEDNQYGRIACEFLKSLPNSSVDDSSELRKQLEVVALDARKLYFMIINYRGPAVPDLCTTIMKNIHSPTHITSKEQLMVRSRLMGSSGIWINIALTQLLVFYLRDGNKGNSIADWGISLKRWLRHGSSCVDGKCTGMGAQLLVVSFQLKLLYATLEDYSFSTLEKTLRCWPEDSGGLHREPSNYVLINSVLSAILRCNPTSKKTLQFIGKFLEKRIPGNMEMRVKFIKYANGLDKSDYDVRELFERMKRELPTSTLLTDMRIALNKTGK